MGVTNFGTLFLDGKRLITGEFPEITFSLGDENNVRKFSTSESFSMTVTITHSKMNRKMFVHSLKNLGYSKNDAKKVSWFCCKKRIPYNRARTMIVLGIPLK